MNCTNLDVTGPAKLHLCNWETQFLPFLAIQCHIQMFFEYTFFLKSGRGCFSVTLEFSHCGCCESKNILYSMRLRKHTCVSWKYICDTLRDLISFVQFNVKNAKNIHGGVFLLVKLQTSAYNFTKSKTSPYVFFMLFNLRKLYQMKQT